MTRPPLAAWPWILAIFVALAALLYVAHGRPARVPAPAAPAVHTHALATCTPPSEHELLHIAITQQRGRLVADCVYMGPRGAYRRSRHGMPEPRP